MASRRAFRRDPQYAATQRQAALHDGAVRQESERTTRESLRDLSGVRHVFSGAVPAEPSAWATRLPCVPNRQICAQTTAHLTALTAIHTRRYSTMESLRVALGSRYAGWPAGSVTDTQVVVPAV